MPWRQVQVHLNYRRTVPLGCLMRTVRLRSARVKGVSLTQIGRVLAIVSADGALLNVFKFNRDNKRYRGEHSPIPLRLELNAGHSNLCEHPHAWA